MTEQELWGLINAAGWKFWGVVAALGVCGIWNILRLAPARTLYGRLIRFVGLIGFGMIAFCWANTAFVPLGIPFVMLSFLGLTHQLYRQCKESGEIPAPAPRSAGLKLAAAIVEHK